MEAEGVFVVSRKSRKRGRGISVVWINKLVAIMIAFAIVAGGIVAFFAIRANSSIGIERKSFYFLQMGEFTSSGDALNKSIEVRNAGGAGYVLNDGIFRVMAAVYSSASDAAIVEKKLTDSGKSCLVYEVRISKQKLTKLDSDAENALSRELFLFPIERLFSELQSVDIAVDEGRTTESSALLSCANLRKEIADGYEEIVSLLSKYPANELLNSLEDAYKLIQSAFNNYLPSNELSVGSNIKSILCSIVEIYSTSVG